MTTRLDTIAEQGESQCTPLGDTPLRSKFSNSQSILPSVEEVRTVPRSQHTLTAEESSVTVSRRRSKAMRIANLRDSGEQPIFDTGQSPARHAPPLHNVPAPNSLPTAIPRSAVPQVPVTSPVDTRAAVKGQPSGRAACQSPVQPRRDLTTPTCPPSRLPRLAPSQSTASTSSCRSRESQNGGSQRSLSGIPRRSACRSLSAQTPRLPPSAIPAATPDPYPSRPTPATDPVVRGRRQQGVVAAAAQRETRKVAAAEDVEDDEQYFVSPPLTERSFGRPPRSPSRRGRSPGPKPGSATLVPAPLLGDTGFNRAGALSSPFCMLCVAEQPPARVVAPELAHLSAGALGQGGEGEHEKGSPLQMGALMAPVRVTSPRKGLDTPSSCRSSTMSLRESQKLEDRCAPHPIALLPPPAQDLHKLRPAHDVLKQVAPQAQPRSGTGFSSGTRP